MRLSALRFVFVVSACLSLVSCSNTDGDSGAAVAVVEQEGKAVCIFAASGRDYPLGEIADTQVNLFDMYGGTSISMEDLTETLEGIEAADAEGLDYRAERSLIQNVIRVRLGIDAIPPAGE